MVRFAASTTALLLAAGTVLNAKPIVQPRISHTSKNTTISANNTTTSGNTTTTSGNTTTVAKYDVGFDDSLVRTLKTTDVVPELVFLDSPEYKTLASADNVTSLEPFIPSQDRSEINGKNADSFKRWINGKDDREQFTSKEYPWASVGRIGWSNGVVCSGALVGPRHVLTAKHCALVENATARFAPGYDNGAPFGTGQVTQIAMNGIPGGDACGTMNDWAVMVLDDKLGTKMGYFGVQVANPDVKRDWPGFWSMGYPGDRDGTQRPYRVEGNSILSSKPWNCNGKGPIYTDTDVSGGQSGAPLWGRTGDKRYILGALSVGIQSGSESWAGWASGQSMVSAIDRVRKDFP